MKHESDICKPFTNYIPRHVLIPNQWGRKYMERFTTSDRFIYWVAFNVRLPYEGKLV